MSEPLNLVGAREPEPEEDDLDEFEEEPEDIGIRLPTSRPGMIAVRRRSRRRRRRRPTADVRFRQVRVVMLCIIAFMIVLQLCGAHLKGRIQAVIATVFRPFFDTLFNLHFEVVALLVAFLILIYLTPGVEDYVLRVVGIRGGKRQQRH